VRLGNDNWKDASEEDKGHCNMRSATGDPTQTGLFHLSQPSVELTAGQPWLNARQRGDKTGQRDEAEGNREQRQLQK